MSKAAKDGNNFRREWDKEAFEKRAKERLEAELTLEDERERKKTEPRAIVQRAPLQRRTEDLQLTKHVNSRQVVTGAEAMAGQMAGAYYCKVCECHLRDSQNYLAHINGKKHNRMLGMSMRAERSTLGEVRSRLEAHKADGTLEELTAEEKAARYLEEFDERMREREEQARAEAAEKRRLQRQGAGSSSTTHGSSSSTHGALVATGGDGEQAGPGEALGDEAEEEDPEQAAMAAMGFAVSFGGSRKDN